MRFLTVITCLFCIAIADIIAGDYSEIDKTVNTGISNSFYPGAQLLIGNENNIIYKQNYGNFTYDEFSNIVTDESMFDIASLTKVVATTTSIMILYNNGRIDLNEYVSKYIPEFKSNGKDEIKVINLLVHNSGLEAWRPFYKTCSTKEDVLAEIFEAELNYPIGSKTLYSDLNAVLLGLIVERITGTSLDKFCMENIFVNLGMKNSSFNPEESFKKNILPTENDAYWRMRQIQGEVHDETASLMGGVSGNAGMFSNATDLYKFMQMMLKEGMYYNVFSRGLKEERMFKPEIVRMFTAKYPETNYFNTRALGWETKPEQKRADVRIPCGELISENCFGHTGFTGTSIWCDIDRKLIIIFLTNRIYPSRENYGIGTVRPEVHNKAIETASKMND